MPHTKKNLNWADIQEIQIFLQGFLNEKGWIVIAMHEDKRVDIGDEDPISIREHVLDGGFDCLLRPTSRIGTSDFFQWTKSDIHVDGSDLSIHKNSRILVGFRGKKKRYSEFSYWAVVGKEDMDWIIIHPLENTEKAVRHISGQS